MVRGFAGYLHTIDPAHEIIPPAGLIGVHVGRAVPYLYSDNDIATLMAEAERLDRPLRRATIATVIGLLAVTGMRIGEVIGLDDTDFDPDQQLFTVRHAKLGKHRLLPLHPSTVDAVNGYRRRRDSVFAQIRPHAALLVSGAGTRLLHCNVGQTIAKLARSAGLAARSPGCRPRPHDLRHTFVVNTLLDGHRRRRRRRRPVAVVVDLPRACRPSQHLLVSAGRPRVAHRSRPPTRSSPRRRW